MFPPQRQNSCSPLQQACCQNSSAALRFICNASVACAAPFWHCSDCLCIDATSPACPDEMLHSAVTLGLLCITQLMLSCTEIAVFQKNQTAGIFTQRKTFFFFFLLRISESYHSYEGIPFICRNIRSNTQRGIQKATQGIDESLNCCQNSMFYMVCRDKYKSLVASLHAHQICCILNILFSCFSGDVSALLLGDGSMHCCSPTQITLIFRVGWLWKSMKL